MAIATPNVHTPVVHRELIIATLHNVHDVGVVYFEFPVCLQYQCSSEKCSGVHGIVGA